MPSGPGDLSFSRDFKIFFTSPHVICTQSILAAFNVIIQPCLSYHIHIHHTNFWPVCHFDTLKLYLGRTIFQIQFGFFHIQDPFTWGSRTWEAIVQRKIHKTFLNLSRIIRLSIEKSKIQSFKVYDCHQKCLQCFSIRRVGVTYYGYQEKIPVHVQISLFFPYSKGRELRNHIAVG